MWTLLKKLECSNPNETKLKALKELKYILPWENLRRVIDIQSINPYLNKRIYFKKDKLISYIIVFYIFNRHIKK